MYSQEEARSRRLEWQEEEKRREESQRRWVNYCSTVGGTFHDQEEA